MPLRFHCRGRNYDPPLRSWITNATSFLKTGTLPWACLAWRVSLFFFSFLFFWIDFATYSSFDSRHDREDGIIVIRRIDAYVSAIFRRMEGHLCRLDLKSSKYYIKFHVSIILIFQRFNLLFRSSKLIISVSIESVFSFSNTYEDMKYHRLDRLRNRCSPFHYGFSSSRDLYKRCYTLLRPSIVKRVTLLAVYRRCLDRWCEEKAAVFIRRRYIALVNGRVNNRALFFSLPSGDRNANPILRIRNGWQVIRFVGKICVRGFFVRCFVDRRSSRVARP